MEQGCVGAQWGLGWKTGPVLWKAGWSGEQESMDKEVTAPGDGRVWQGANKALCSKPVATTTVHCCPTTTPYPSASL